MDTEMYYSVLPNQWKQNNNNKTCSNFHLECLYCFSVVCMHAKAYTSNLWLFGSVNTFSNIRKNFIKKKKKEKQEDHDN